MLHEQTISPMSTKRKAETEAEPLYNCQPSRRIHLPSINVGHIHLYRSSSTFQGELSGGEPDSLNTSVDAAIGIFDRGFQVVVPQQPPQQP